VRRSSVVWWLLNIFHDGSAKYISTYPHSAHCLHRDTSLPSPPIWSAIGFGMLMNSGVSWQRRLARQVSRLIVFVG
jgi:hypothetical protein